MNKLSELIDAVDNMEYLSESKLSRYLYERRKEIAGLIDAAHDILGWSDVVKGASIKDAEQLRIALSKLEK
jgi:hypothetical protein